MVVMIPLHVSTLVATQLSPDCSFTTMFRRVALRGPSEIFKSIVSFAGKSTEIATSVFPSLGILEAGLLKLAKVTASDVKSDASEDGLQSPQP